MYVKINGTQVYIQKNSLTIDSAIEERSTSSFVVADIDGLSHYEKGQKVEIFNDDNTLEFAGVIETSAEKRVGSYSLLHSIKCIDWHYLADKRVIAKAYENMYAGDIVKDIIDKYLKNEGVTFNDVTSYLSDKMPTFTDNSNSITVKFDKSLELERDVLVDATPTMTGNTTPAPYSASDEEASNSAYMAFDKKNTTAADFGVVSPTIPAYLEFNFGAGNSKVINRYGIQAYSGLDLSRAPKDFQLQAYNTANSTWITLDTRTGILWRNLQYQEFEFSNYTAYERYRLWVTDDNINDSSSSLIIAELKLFLPSKIKYLEGVIISDPLDFDAVGINRGSELTWTETIPVGTSVKVQTSIDNGFSWQVATNGERIPNLYGGEDLTKIDLLIKVTLTTVNDNLSPNINNFRVKFIDKKGTLQQGTFVESAVFNYIPVSEALGSLAEKSTFWWDINQFKELRFTERSTNIAPFVVDVMSIQRDSLTVEHGNKQYRNQQYILGGKDITDIQTEIFKGNGSQQTFTVGYPVSKVPKIYVDNVDQGTIGIRGLDDKDEEVTKKWFWSKGDNTITQNKNHSALTSTQTFKIEYQGEFDIVVISKNTDEIGARQLIEVGTTGIVENVVEDKSIESRELGFKAANTKLERFGKVGSKIHFTTWKQGLEAGQILTANFPVHNLNNVQFLIESIAISNEDDMPFYDVNAYFNTTEGSWTKFFYELSIKGRTNVIRENIGDDQVLTILETFQKTWTQTERPNIFYDLLPSSTTLPSNTTYPSFDYDQRVKYVSLYYAGVDEMVRKQITKQTLSQDTKTLTSTANIQSSEANDFPISHIAWWGGTEASIEKGTGILIEKVPYAKQKTALESLQIDRIDRKGW